MIAMRTSRSIQYEASVFTQPQKLKVFAAQISLVTTAEDPRSFCESWLGRKSKVRSAACQFRQGSTVNCVVADRRWSWHKTRHEESHRTALVRGAGSPRVRQYHADCRRVGA